MVETDPTKKGWAIYANKYTKYLQRVKRILDGTDSHFKYPLTLVRRPTVYERRQAQKKGLVAGVSTGIYLKEVLLHLHRLEFELRKDVVRLFSRLVALDVGEENELVEYLYNFHRQYIEYAIEQYCPTLPSQSIATTMLRTSCSARARCSGPSWPSRHHSFSEPFGRNSTSPSST